MKYHADCSYHIGAQHLRLGVGCQDYAIAGDLPGCAYAVVSDGCSSGGRTDIGARLISLAAAKHLREEYLNLDGFVGGVNVALELFDLNQSDMLATCMMMRITKNGVFVIVQGDGVVATSDQTGSICMMRMDWDKNMPCYPCYAGDEFAGFIAAHGGPDVKAFRVEVHENDRISHTQYISVKDGTKGHSFYVSGRLNSIAMFSDGVTQIDGIKWQDAVRQLMSFKSTEGDFVKRRMNRFLKDAEKIGRGPIDDIAMAAIVIEDSNGEGDIQGNS